MCRRTILSRSVFCSLLAVGSQLEQLGGPDGLQASDIDWTWAGLVALGWGTLRVVSGYLGKAGVLGEIGKKLV